MYHLKVSASHPVLKDMCVLAVLTVIQLVVVRTAFLCVMVESYVVKMETRVLLVLMASPWVVVRTTPFCAMVERRVVQMGRHV